MKKAIFVVLCVNALLLAGRYCQELVYAQDQPPTCATMNGDVNVDGRIDISDAVSILRHIILGDPVELVAICEAEGGELDPVVELLTRIADRPQVDLGPIVEEIGRLRATLESPSPVSWDYKFLVLGPQQEVEVASGAGLLHGIVFGIASGTYVRFELRNGPQGDRIAAPMIDDSETHFLPLDVRFDRGVYLKNTQPRSSVNITILYRSS